MISAAPNDQVGAFALSFSLIGRHDSMAEVWWLRHSCRVHALLRSLHGLSCEASCLQVRALAKQARAGKYKSKVSAQEQRREHRAEHPMPLGEFAHVFR